MGEMTKCQFLHDDEVNPHGCSNTLGFSEKSQAKNEKVFAQQHRVWPSP